jgi:hypothetical protein
LTCVFQVFSNSLCKPGPEVALNRISYYRSSSWNKRKRKTHSLSPSFPTLVDCTNSPLALIPAPSEFHTLLWTSHHQGGEATQSRTQPQTPFSSGSAWKGEGGWPTQEPVGINQRQRASRKWTPRKGQLEWAEENPHEIHTEPFHSEKIGMWHALSHRPIISPIFFDQIVTTEM